MATRTMLDSATRSPTGNFAKTNSTVFRARTALERRRVAIQKKARREFRKFEKKVQKRRQTILHWLGSGFAHYYWKFLGLWKPEISMGIVADITFLQNEQQRVLSKLTEHAKYREPAVGRTLEIQGHDKQDLKYVLNLHTLF